MINQKEVMERQKLADQETGSVNSVGNIIRFFFFSAIGIFMFFIPIELNGKSSIPLDHFVTWIRAVAGTAAAYYVMIIVVAGAIYPFYKKTWRRNNVETVLSGFKVLGAVAAFLVLFDLGPVWLMAEEMGPYWFYSLLIPIGILVPIGAVFLAMLVGYGLLEFIGILMQPIMRPLWKTPGKSAIDAVASFVGSYSIGLLITNRIYKEGKYTQKEATIIATGFSTVSATFMIVVAKTLDLMHLWNLYFWLTFLVTFAVTAITVRIWPINKISDNYYTEKGFPEESIKANRIGYAWKEAMITAHNAPAIKKNITANVKDGLVMAMGILPSIMSIGLMGLILANYTPVFDYLGYLFYPLTWLLQIPEPMLAAKAAAINLIDMFLPSLVVLEADVHTRFIIGSLSISTILFFSALIPCILSTEIPIKMSHLLGIWLIRTVLTLIMITPLAFLFL